MTRDLVSDLAEVWEEEGGGGEGLKIQGAHCFPRACIRLLPLNKTLFQFPLTHPYLSPFSPLEELSRSWWRPAAAASGDSDRRG